MEVDTLYTIKPDWDLFSTFQTSIPPGLFLQVLRWPPDSSKLPLRILVKGILSGANSQLWKEIQVC